MRGARSNPQPFVVPKLTHSDFFNFKPLAETLKNKFPWRQLCSVEHYKTGIDGSVNIAARYKTAYSREFNEVSLDAPTAGVRTRESRRPANPSRTLLPQPAYKKELPIATKNYQGLMKMCADSIIPPEYHDFYRALKHSTSTRDALPQPDEEESDLESE